jgi:serine/threonine-protein kinase
VAKVKLLDPVASNAKLGRYELIGEIAAGGMATVFLARLGGAGGFQRFVAIKRLHPHLAHEDEFVEMFLDEARLAAAIHHPHVVSILEVGTSDDGYYLVMEYVEGDTLARLARRAASAGTLIARPVLMRIVLDTLAGLHAAHEQTDASGAPMGLVHRDVSPQNILVGTDGCSRITDFGIARASARLTSTRAGQMKGKLAYMAPEQARGEPLDRRADLFAMGAITWEALTGQRLFKGETEVATLARVMSGLIPRVSELDAGLGPALDAVCARALERDAEARFQSAADMADALERAALAPDGPGLASPREVATYVQELLGQEMSEQRDSVRTWLAKCESSTSNLVTTPFDRPSRGGAAALSAPRPVEPEPEPDLEPDAVSPIDTSVMRPTQPSALAPTEPPPRRARRSAVLWIAAIAAILALGLVAWIKRGSARQAILEQPPPTPLSAAPLASSIAPSAVPVGVTAVAAPTPSIAGASTSPPPTTTSAASSASTAAPSLAPPRAPASTSTPSRPPRPVAAPAKPAGDDLSNPYR